jgi:hypothetical protein
LRNAVDASSKATISKVQDVIVLQKLDKKYARRAKVVTTQWAFF